MKEFDVVCLQKDIKTIDKECFDSLGGRIRFYGAELNDFADTAALANSVDLIICLYCRPYFY
jgi:hypothetical protein